MSDLANRPVRWSWLSRFLSSPLHARDAALHGKDPTPAMKLGTAGHVVTFEQPYQVFRKENPKTGLVWTRAAKAWDEEEERCKAEGKPLITVAEYDKACRIRDALRGNADAAHLLFGAGTVREQVIHWHRGEEKRACSSTPDARKPGDWIADLKCTRTAEPEKFSRGFPWTTYAGQLRFYREADCFDTNRSIGRLGPDLYIVAIEPFAPYAVTVFELDATARDHGDRQIATCWERLIQAERFNEWPGYAQGVVPLSVEERDAEPQFIDDKDERTADEAA